MPVFPAGHKRSNSREKILDAAAQIIREVGSGRLTLDAVAQRAGISKGGLLYNFPSKDALLQGMILRIVDDVALRKTNVRNTLKSGPNLEARAIIAVQMDMREPISKDLALGILAASAENPDLLSPLKQVIGETFQALKSDVGNPQTAIIAWLAAEGLRNLEMHDLSPLSEDDRQKFIDALKLLLEQNTSDPA